MTVAKKKVNTRFRPIIYSRHPSHSILRGRLELLPFRSLIRLGSITDKEDTVSNGGARIELNTIQAIKNSASKLRMKQKFTEADVKTAAWISYNPITFTDNINDLEYPIVAKHHFGSKGRGNTLIKTQEELVAWMGGKTLSNYIFEKFYNYAHEFRLHISEDGCFYTCRKALKKDIPEEEKWHFHDDTCVWFKEDNEAFFRPNSWDDIVSDCVKALKAIGADILAFDVKVQSPSNNKGKIRDYQDYILLESNSAPSFGDVTAEMYLQEIPKVLRRKHS